MFLNLNHRRLVGYSVARSLVNECYKISNSFPIFEKYGISSQIRRAAVSVYLNIAEGASRKSDVERKRYFEIARGSIMEIDAILDIAYDNGYLEGLDITGIQEKIVRSFKLISGMIASENLFNYIPASIHPSLHPSTSSPPMFLPAVPGLWRVAHHWARCHAIRGCLP